MNLPLWLRQVWPNPDKRRALVESYRALGLNKTLLADVALRGGVFAAQDAPANLFEAGVNEGRRQMALEFLKLAGTDPELLLAHVESKPRQEKRDG